MFELIKTCFAYSSWATAQVLDAVEQLTPEEYNAPGCSGHGSIRDTLAHLMAAQWRWLSWFDGSVTATLAQQLNVTGESIDTVGKARERWLGIDTQATECVNGLNDDKLRDLWNWTLPTGRSDSLPLWKLLMHVANHGTHVRAQIIAAVRRAGHQPSNIDFLNYSLINRG
ncbi:MAG: DinB family protein [Gemmatimonadota bacterium]|nr:DinB family protein [Gemmatimonadota bacterium]